MDDKEKVVKDEEKSEKKAEKETAATVEPKKEEQKESGKKEAAKEEEKKAADKKSVKEDSSKDEEKTEKKESAKEEKKADKKDSAKDEEKTDKKESVKDEKKADEKDSAKDEEKTEKKDSSKDEEKADKKDSAKEEGKKAEKETAATDESKKAEQEESSKKEVVKEESGNAISQSKRLADAKMANAGVEIKTSGKAPGKGKKVLGIIFGCFAGLVLIAYVAGFIYFSGHFYQDVAINGVDVSNMNQAEAKQALDDFYKAYCLTIVTIDGKEIKLVGNDISMKIVLHDEFDSCFDKQESYLWFVNMLNHHDYAIGADATYDNDALTAQINSMNLLNKTTMVTPRDAYVGVEDNKFVIIEEIMGSTLLEDKFKSAIAENLNAVQFSVNLLDAGCYQLPKVYAKDAEITSELEAKNVYAASPVKLQLDDLVLEPGMQLYEDVLEKKGDTYAVSKALVKKYVGKLAEKYNTINSERVFTTSFDNKKVSVLGTAFGYELNVDETTDKLYAALTGGKAATVEAVFDQKGYTLQGENDIGNTYVEVNLSEQRVIAYKNGRKIAEGDCVSGKESVGHGTTIGLYAIQDKLSPTVLRGEKKPVTKTEVWFDEFGQPFEHTTTTMEYDYESPVTFWLQFNGGIGLHDAAGWRSAYGGSIYYYSGSHGCVNLPYDLAKTLYENFQIGDPVVVYFWDNENRR